MQMADVRSDSSTLLASRHWQISNNLGYNMTLNTTQPSNEDITFLPQDPRQWTREHVAAWLSYISRRHNLCDVQEDRFLMNGKALCLMSLHMFLARVPLGGKLLYKDFQLRLARAMYEQSR